MYIEPNPLLPPGERPRLVEPALEALLARSAIQVRIVAELHKCGSWFADSPRLTCGIFHLVASGRCQVFSDELDAPMELSAGDLVIFPHGAPHQLGGNFPGEEYASLICGEFGFSGISQHPLNVALLGCFVVRASQVGSTFRQLSAAMVDLVQTDCTGRKLLLDKLADALFTLAICEHARSAKHDDGLFASLADPRIARVLQAIHDNPGRAWTMQLMAELACMSRSAFADRFTQLMRHPPIQYLTKWRVSVAQLMLRDRRQSVAGIAEELGYSSEAAFRRLFKRVSGMCPGRLRVGLN